MNAQLVVTVKPYSVLGENMTPSGYWNGVTGKPDTNTAVLDPAGLQFIQSSPHGAKGASESIYKWLGISNAPSFPSDVKDALDSPLKAKYHAYGDNSEKKCIHVVGPDFNSDPCDYSTAVEKLAQVYEAALVEFADSPVTTLRLLPISSGIFAGALKDEMPNITAEALITGFSRLTPNLQKIVKERTLVMCIAEPAKSHKYKDAFSSPNINKHFANNSSRAHLQEILSTTASSSIATTPRLEAASKAAKSQVTAPRLDAAFKAAKSQVTAPGIAAVALAAATGIAALHLRSQTSDARRTTYPRTRLSH